MDVQRIWRRHEIEPHRLERHMVSNDPDFETKAADVIGLYLNPPGPRGSVLRGRKDGDPDARPQGQDAAAVAGTGRKIMRYIRPHSKDPKPIKWKYADPSRRIRCNSSVSAD